MSSEMIPDEVLREAADLVMRVCPSVSATENTDRIVALSKALLAAEQRGLEKAAVVAEGLYLQETENHGDLYDGDVAAAIRSLGEKT